MVTFLDTKLGPIDIPSCGKILKLPDTGYFWWSTKHAWGKRPEGFSGERCGETKEHSFYYNRRCTKCMKAVGILW